MKKGIVPVALLLYLHCASALWAQAFTNLDFESANVSNLLPNQSEFVPAADGLPGWSAYIGTSQLTEVGHNVVTLGSPNVGVLGPQYNTSLSILEQALQGSYSAILQAGGGSVSIAQTGLIPSSANSLQFEAAFVARMGDLSVMVGGQNIPFVSISNDLYGCNISSLAGSEENITFTMQGSDGDLLILLDAITFSMESIPEPSSLVLLLIGVVGLGFWHVAQRNRCRLRDQG